MSPQTTRQHILEAAINAIEKHGVQNITTRKIALEAGVNNAALHYYFGTKENLVSLVLSTTLEHMVADTGEILTGAGSLEDRLAAIFQYLIDGVLRFPNLIRAHIHSPLMEGDAGSPFVRMLDEWLERVYRELQPEWPPDKRTTLLISMHTAISAILIAGLMPGVPGKPSCMDLRDPAFRTRYVRYLVNSIVRPT